MILTNSTDVLASFIITNATLTFTNWNTALRSTDIIIRNNGKLQTTACNTNALISNTNRVFLSCSNLTILAGGSINVTEQGYIGGRSGQVPSFGTGPGGGASSGSRGGGGGHGGPGGYADNGPPPAGGPAYDSESQPSIPGSGGGGGSSFGKNGGGAVWIEATGDVIVNGSILADGGAGWDQSGSGAGGSIYIGCRSLDGAGTIRASGLSTNSNSGGGGGGRIAVNYTPAAQAMVSPKPRIAFSVAPGLSGTTGRYGTIGTLWFPDTSILPPLMSYFGQLVIPASSSWAPDSLTVSNGTVVFPDAFQLNVANDLVIRNNGGLNLTNSATLTVGRDLLMTNASFMQIVSPLTNGTLSYGTLVTVSGSLAIASGCNLYPKSHPTNGGSIKFAVSNLLLNAGATISADTAGWSGTRLVRAYGPGAGYSSGDRGGGGGFGGGGGKANTGTSGGPVYGLASAPAWPGSGGGGGGSVGGNGGGLLWVDASSLIDLRGTITANGGANGDQNGGGSGGGIYLIAPLITGTGGVVRANGGTGGSNSGAGGGGRIAFTGWTTNQFDGTVTVNGGTATTGSPGTNGTVYMARTDSYPFTLNVRGYPKRHEIASPYDYGAYALAADSAITDAIPQVAEQTASSRYFLLGWSVTNGAGTVLAADITTQAEFTVSSDVTLTWKWTNQWYLNVTAGANGGLLEEKTGWYTNGNQVTITATAATDFAFSSWVGTGVPVGQNGNNPITLTLDQARTLSAVFVSTLPVPRTWTGTNLWLSQANWTPNGIPGPRDDLTIQSGQVIIPDPVSSGTLTVGPGATLVFSNWVASLTVSNLTVQSNGVITHVVCNTNGAPANTNRVNIICSNITLNAFGLVDVNSKGYIGGTGGNPGQGPGAGQCPGAFSGGGAGYGGVGGISSHGSAGGVTYGSPYMPDIPGSGGGGGTIGTGSGGAGGGAVRIVAANQAVVNGTIRSNGGTPPAGGKNGGGSGGGIYMACRTLEGNGLIQANGGNGVDTESAGAGGGRIAVAYDVAAQTALPSQPTIRYSVSQGAPMTPGPGTLYLPANALLPDRVSDVLTGSILVYGVTNWNPSSGYVSNAVIRFVDPITVNVATDLVVTASGGLDLGGTFLTIGGQTLLTNGGTLTVRAGLTNAARPNYGGSMEVAGSITVATNSILYVAAHPTNGGPLKVHASALNLALGGQVNANGLGYSQGYGPGRGGTGANSGGGGGYGGAGGIGSHNPGSDGGLPYGAPTETPLQAGSAGGISGAGGGAGGGLVWLEIDNELELNGLITANGLTPPGYGGGGSGGGIYLRCGLIRCSSTGVLRANGANGGSESGGGGGGRIYVVRRFQRGELLSEGSVAGGPLGSSIAQPGTAGTVVWAGLDSGTLIMIR